MELKKSSKRFVISTETENDKGFRVRSAGVDISEYPKNPLLLWMHKMPKGERRDEVLPLGNGVDVAFENGELYGTPAFDTSDVFAVDIHNKVENGTIRMASAGLLPITWGKDEECNLWLLESKLIEWSLCPIGSNPDAFAVQLYNENNEVITLSSDYLDSIDLQTKFNADMKKIELSADVIGLVGLTGTPTNEAVEAKIKEVVELAASQKTKLETLASEKYKVDAQLVTLKSEKETAEAKVVELTAAAEEAKVVELVSAAVTAKKIVEGDRDKYVKLAKADFDTTKEILEGMAAHPSAKERTEQNKDSDNAKKVQELVAKGYDALDKSGQLETLRTLSEIDFQNLYEGKFGKKYGEK